MRILAIDPGNTESGWCVIDADTRRPEFFGKDRNEDVLRICYGYGPPAFENTDDPAVIEMVASYGMSVGAEVFETCVWIGRFQEALHTDWWHRVDLVKRLEIKLHHCHDTRAKDTNIRQALVDRFAPGQPNHGKGTKNEPGWFHGFHSDIWQAYALAVYAADQLNPQEATA